MKKLLDVIQGDNLRSELLRGAMGAGGLRFLSIPLGVAASIIIARYLGPEGYGKYSFVMSVVTILSIPIGSGIKQFITREVATYHQSENWSLLRGLLLRSHQWVFLISMLCIGIITFLSIYNAEWQLNDRWTLQFIAIFILPFLGLEAIRGGSLRGLSYVVSAQVPEHLVRPGFHLGTILALLFFGFLNPATTLISQIIASLAAFIAGTYLLFKRMPSNLLRVGPRFKNREWISTWVPFTLLMAVTLFNNQIGVLVLGWLGTDQQIGAFRVAARGAQFIALPLSIVNMVISPYITRTFRDGNFMRLQKLSSQSARSAFVFALPIAIPLIFFGAPLIRFIFGEEYAEISVIPLAILAVGQLVNVIFGSVGMFLIMSGYERDTLVGQVIALVINSLGAVLLIPRFGAEGAASATAAGMIVWNILLAIKFKKNLKLKPTIF